LVALGIIIEVKNPTERWIVSAPTLFDFRRELTFRESSRACEGSSRQ